MLNTHQAKACLFSFLLLGNVYLFGGADCRSTALSNGDEGYGSQGNERTLKQGESTEQAASDGEQLPGSGAGEVRATVADETAGFTSDNTDVGTEPATTVEEKKTDAVNDVTEEGTSDKEQQETDGVQVPGLVAAEKIEGKPLTVEALEQAVTEASEAQEARQEEKSVAQVVEQAPAVVLRAGDGDVATTGKCTDVINKHCQEVTPGEGRIAECLTLAVADSKITVPNECRDELDKFKLERAGNIGANLPLVTACKEDIVKLCAAADDGKQPGSVLACLRKSKQKLSTGCSNEVFKAQVEAANDFRTDVKLHETCRVDAEKLCEGLEPVNGQIQSCLQEHRAQLSWDCQEQLFRQELENADDLRLSVRLFKKCLQDKRKFCAEVAPGNVRALDCLEEHREEPGFSEGCKEEVEAAVARRIVDFRLDPILRDNCVADVQNLCGYQGGTLDSMPDAAEHRVVKCLQDFSDEVANDACKSRVYKIKSLAASDIRFDVSLAEACYDDRQKLCKDVPPGSARVIRCLLSKGAMLSSKCSALLFDHELAMAESIDFQAPMKQACVKEHEKFCADIPHGQGRVIRCLQDNKDKSEYSEACKNELQLYEQHASTDYRLNFRLQKACAESISSLCAAVCVNFKDHRPCGGSVLRCLTDAYDNITQADCQTEVFYYMKMEVRDYRNGMLLAEACRQDVEGHCRDVKPGEGRVLQCLSDKRSQLQQNCKTEVVRFEVLQSSNIELRPGIAKACADERNVHCSSVRAGRARVLNCLLSKSEQVDFSPKCVAGLRDMMVKRVKDWRSDYTLRNACRKDVYETCTEAVRDQDSGSGAVLKCLMTNSDQLRPSCSREVSRAVRNALDLYTQHLPGVDICDPVVLEVCLKSNSQAEKQAVGSIRSCLLAHYAHNENNTTKSEADRRLLQAASGLTCERVAALSNPPDVYDAFHKSLRVSSLVVYLQKMEQTLGVKHGTLVKPRATSSGGITLTGFWALAGMLAMVGLLLGGAWMYFFKNYDKYTVVLKTKPAVANVDAGKPEKSTKVEP